jgi:hypothetical protein
LRRFRAVAILLVAAILAGAPPAWAQMTSSRNIAVLPFQSTAADSTLAAELYRGFLAGIRPLSSLRLLPPGAVEQAVGATGVRSALANTTALGEYAVRSGSAFVIGGVVSRTEEGAIEVTSAVYAQDDGRVLQVGSQTYDTPSEALDGMDRFARRMSHPRNLTSSDTAFFYSVFVPGLGQLSQGSWKHALVSASLVGLAALYSAAAPEPDFFSVPAGRFSIDWDDVSEHWRYSVGGVVYDRESYYTIRFDEMKRAERSLGQRREAEDYRKRAKALFVGAWILNVFDTLYLASRPVDSGRFFQLVTGLEPGPSGLLDLTLRLRINFPEKERREGR